MDPSSSSERIRKDLLDAQVALDQGDYFTVKRRLKTLTDPSIQVPTDLREDITRLERAVAPDPAVKYLAAGCLAFFVVITVHYVF
jgi:hypothetical protein